MGVVLATSAWSYVTVTYGATLVIIGGYTAWILRRGRKVGRQLPPEERKWS
jgi:hypothetical protein